jgi:hypothetical protein
VAGRACYHLNRPQRTRQDVAANPGPLIDIRRLGAYLAANVMTIMQEIILSIAIAMCVVGLSNMIWSALAALW